MAKGLVATIAALAVAAACAARAPAAQATSGGGPRSVLKAAFSPERLGAATAVSFAVSIDPPAERPPPPLSSIDFGYPPGLGFATSGLGLAACDPGRLEAEGASACPRNAKVGAGSATAEVAFGPDIVQEHVALELFAGPSADGYLHLLILATGREPIEARIVMSGVVLPGHLQISVPAVGGLPGGPDVALSRLQATIGGPLTYYEHVGHRTIAYRPPGIGLPARCPPGGWRLAAALAFFGGLRSSAHTVVGCPRRR